MSYFKLGSVMLLIATSSPLSAASNQEPTQEEVKALRSAYSQFEAIDLDGESAYKKSQDFLEDISKSPTNIKHPGNVVFTREDAKLFREGYKKAQELGIEEIQRPEWLQSSKASEWERITTDIGKNTATAVENRIKKAYPKTKDKKVEIVRGNDPQNGFLAQDEDLYFFITSAMKSNEISDVLVSAKQTGATVVMRGMLPNTTVLTDTSKYLLQIMKTAKLDKAPPKIVIDPRLFNVFGINSAPAMAYSKADITLTAHGFASPDWFVREARSLKATEKLPSLSSTQIIVEEDIIELLERKYREIDVKKQREKAVNSFFARQTFKVFPVSSKDRFYELDPRIQFTKDVYAGGRLMAKKGDVVNPLAGFEGMNRSLFIIDPRDPRQKSLVKERLYKDAVGNPTILVSHLDADKKFDGITELQNEFQHKIYMLQKIYIDRFKITALPMRIDMVGGKGIWIEEYGVETINKIHSKFEGLK